MDDNLKNDPEIAAMLQDLEEKSKIADKIIADYKKTHPNFQTEFNTEIPFPALQETRVSPVSYIISLFAVVAIIAYLSAVAYFFRSSIETTATIESAGYYIGFNNPHPEIRYHKDHADNRDNFGYIYRFLDKNQKTHLGEVLSSNKYTYKIGDKIPIQYSKYNPDYSQLAESPSTIIIGSIVILLLIFLVFFYGRRKDTVEGINNTLKLGRAMYWVVGLVVLIMVIVRFHIL